MLRQMKAVVINLVGRLEMVIANVAQIQTLRWKLIGFGQLILLLQPMSQTLPPPPPPLPPSLSQL